MESEPAGVAIDSTPLLTQLGRQFHLAGLESTLDQPNGGLTVFAPAGSALYPLFYSGELGRLDVDRGRLTNLLDYEIVPHRYDARGLLAARRVPTLDGTPLTISGDGLGLKIGDEQAKVLCGNIPAANATLFVIDSVVRPQASASR